MLLYTVSRFTDAMQTQAVNVNAWQDQFGYTLHGDPSDLWDEVLQDGDKNGVAFNRDEAGFNLTIEFYVQKYVADPNARDTQFQAFNGRAFRFIIVIGRGEAHLANQDALLILTQTTRRCGSNGCTNQALRDELIPKTMATKLHERRSRAIPHRNLGHNPTAYDV